MNTTNKKGGALCGAPPVPSVMTGCFALEAELRGELESTRATSAEHTISARNRNQERSAVRRRALDVKHLGNVGFVTIVGDVKEIKDFANQIELEPFRELERLGQTHILRDKRVAANGCPPGNGAMRLMASPNRSQRPSGCPPRRMPNVGMLVL